MRTIRSNRRGRSRFVVAVACAAPLASGCHKAIDPPRRTQLHEPGIADVTEEMRPFIRTAKLGETNESRRAALTFFGKVGFDEDRLHYAPIGTPVTGRVVRVLAEPGDRVKANQPLLAIYSPDMAGAQAAVQSARTERDKAKARLERAERLVDAGAGSEAELEEAKANLARAQQEEVRANGALGSFGRASGGAELTLTSPIEGTVVSRKAGAGTVVHPDAGDPVVVVADLSKVWVTADVPESDLDEVHIGEAAAVTIQSSAKTFSGRVSRIANQVAADTHTVPVRIEVENEVDPAASDGGLVGYLLKPDMFATIAIDQSSSSRVVVPLSAVLTRRDDFFVFVKRPDGHFHEKRVRVATTIHGDEVSLLPDPNGDAIKPGDEIVVEGAILLDAEANEPLSTTAHPDRTVATGAPQK